MIKASILGATGYAGIELIRILLCHSKVKIQDLVSSSESGNNLADIYPHFENNQNLELKDYDNINRKESDIFFTALPHGVSQKYVADLYQEGLKVVDLSGDFRYSNKDIYEKWYNEKHEFSELLPEAVYGLVENNHKKIKDSSLIANPGCYPTASILGILPALQKNIVSKDSVIVDAKSGVSGAGKSLKRVTHFMEAVESIKAYGVTTHRHTSEIESNLADSLDIQDINILFTPHLVPMKRGILATIYADLTEDLNDKDLLNIYTKFYENSKFVQVDNSNPDTKHVAGTNNCKIGVNVDQRNSKIIIVSAIDNLGKGAAGQAVQNMNIMFGFPEDTGLKNIAMFP